MPQSGHFQKPSFILFDVYETLLDMSDIERRVNHIMDSRRAYLLWFELLMEYSFAENCLNRFRDFMEIAGATLQMTARNFGVTLSERSVREILDMFTHLPVHEEVPQGLSRLIDLDFGLAALTNVPRRVVNERMERTGLISYFKLLLSAEQAKKYKPCPEPYQLAATRLETAPASILMVSAHGWDIAGAAAAGMQTAFLKNDNQLLYPLAPPPQFAIRNLDELVKELALL